MTESRNGAATPSSEQMKQDYTKLDAAILDAVRAGFHSFTEISIRVHDAASAHEMPLRTRSPSPAWRAVDRRLQVLRKSRKLMFDRKAGWRIT